MSGSPGLDTCLLFGDLCLVDYGVLIGTSVLDGNGASSGIQCPGA